jgi:hypothetical protein
LGDGAMGEEELRGGGVEEKRSRGVKEQRR